MQDEYYARCIFAQMPAISIWTAVQLSRLSILHELSSTDTANYAPPHSMRLVGAGEHGRHCGFGSATVEAPDGCEVASNRLASITKFATMLTTDIRNGANRRVSATGLLTA